MTRQERAGYVYPETSWRKTLNPKTKDVGGFRDEMVRKGVNLRYRTETDFLDMLSSLLGIVLTVVLIAVLIKFVSGAVKGFSSDEVLQRSDVRFSDVIGQDEVLEDVRFIAKLIRTPSLGKALNVKPPKGILLSGPPGTGKTLIAKAIAGEAGVPFISVSGSDFKEMYVGVGARRVRQLFAIARQNAPCIMFIDEIDAIGASRDAKNVTTSSEDSQTINAMLKEMDGFVDRKGIFILAATNHPEKLDSAIRRSGRFDREVKVTPPRDWKVRKELLEHFLRGKNLTDDVDLEAFAKQTTGFTGADIEAVCNEAGIVAMMHEKSAIDEASLEEALDKKIFDGNRSKSERFKKDKEIVAYHEAGHAVVHYLLGEEISRASIIGTTSGVGGAVFNADTESVFVTKEQMRNKIKACFGGRASEEIKFGDVTTGASSDITQATNCMLGYIQRYGFDEKFGMLDMESLRNRGILGDDGQVAQLSEMSRELYTDTVGLLRENYALVERLAQELLDKETLSGDEVVEILKGVQTATRDDDSNGGEK
jgi:cell division protease FtsH